mmetsp:Transcript_26484/g.78665  ORF Transcript_26484/g.78665 Transcript_26484/m.78665 type:complete len:135 (+) Transcript_26484:4570-4974(+)
MRLRSNFQPALHTAWSWCDRMACVCVPTSNLHFILRGHGVIGCRLVCAHVSLQSRLDEDTASLAKRQAAFNRDRDQMSNEEEEEYQKAVEESMFRIHILEKRLKRHEEQALHKYYELDHKLRADPRLAQLTKPL